MAKIEYISKDKYIRQLVEELANDGERIIKAAYETRGFNNRTYNLHDSYASAVYVNGVLRHNTIRYVGAEMANSRTNDKELGDYAGDRTRPVYRGGDKRYLKGDTIQAYGRDEAKRFFNDYKPPKDGGIQLVVIAAMFYAGIVESKGYQVLSQSYTELIALANKYGATVKQLDVYRDPNKIGVGSFQIK